MSQRSRDSRKTIRPWTLYVLRFTDNTYYVGITSRRDFMVRINQHGTLDGARVNRTKTTAEIMEIHPLGRITRFAAENIENDMTIEYRKRYGRGRVRGGYNISLVSSLVPNYTPGSLQAVLLIAGCLLLAVVLFAVILYV